MVRFPTPLFRTARNAWFVQIGSRQIKLGEDRDEAFRLYHELMAAPAEPPPVARSELVAVVADAFLDFVQQHRSPGVDLRRSDSHKGWYIKRGQVKRATDSPAHLANSTIYPTGRLSWAFHMPPARSQ